jgi:outer membrane immunogenic protein
MVAAPVFDWTGFYVGGSLGGRWSDTSWTSTCAGDPCTSANAASGLNPSSFNSSTVRVGGYLGYNWQVSPLWVVGLEGDVAWGKSSKTVIGIPGVSPGDPADSTKVKENWDASIRARVGYLITPAVMLYGTGGVAWQQADLTMNCNGIVGGWCDATAVRSETFSTVRTGWTLGGGLEAKLTSNWLLRGEYRYADYGTFGHTFFPTTALCTSSPGTQCDRVVMNQSLKTNAFSVGLGYKF